jgi:hypothetical protein
VTLICWERFNRLRQCLNNKKRLLIDLFKELFCVQWYSRQLSEHGYLGVMELLIFENLMEINFVFCKISKLHV